MEIEEWKALEVPGPKCEINREGEVRMLQANVRGNVIYNWPVNPYRNPHSGRNYFKFASGKASCIKYQHRLVAEAFIPNPDKLPFVMFKQGDSVEASNLYWAKNCR